MRSVVVQRILRRCMFFVSVRTEDQCTEDFSDQTPRGVRCRGMFDSKRYRSVLRFWFRRGSRALQSTPTVRSLSPGIILTHTWKTAIRVVPQLLQNIFTRSPPSEDTWASYELRKVFDKGNLVTEVSEIWQYNVIRYHPATQQGDLFMEYVLKTYNIIRF
jgi:hypothetical protein